MSAEWDLVFTAGWHTDSQGNKRLWTTDDLDKIVNSFNPSFHEPPLVIGHPSNNAPAFGWVGSIKRVGKDLYVKYRDVAGEFQEWAKKKLFKKKSIAVYPDGSLRHVGYLGAVPPAIKGLPDYEFADGDRAVATYEFCDWRMGTVGRIVMRIRDYLIEKEGAEKADQIIGTWEVQDLLTPPVEQEPTQSCYHEEEDMKVEEVQGLIDTALKGVRTEFTDALKGVTEGIKGLTVQFSELAKGQTEERLASQRREFAEFLNTPEMQKRIGEGSREATIAHMMTLVNAEPVEFGEGDQKRKVSAVDNYKNQLRALPPVVEFSEVATKERGATVQEKSATRAEFNKWDATRQSEFCCNGGVLID